MNEKSREYIEDADGGATITGYNYLPFSFISDVKKRLHSQEISDLSLMKGRKKCLALYVISRLGLYHQKEIGNIQGMILPSDSDWDSKNAISIESEK